MWTPVRLNNNKTYDYGFGWGLTQINGHRLIEHGGAWQGFTTYIGRYTDDKVTVIALDNLAGANPGKIARHVAAIYSPELGRHAMPDNEPEVTALVKDLLQQFRDGTADENLFTRDARADVFPARAERIGRLLKFLGAVNKIELAERKKNGDRTYGYQLTFQNGTRFFKITLTADNKIADLAFIDDF
jgi:hypothetical protein